MMINLTIILIIGCLSILVGFLGLRKILVATQVEHITPQPDLAEALQESEQRLRNIVTHTSDGLIIINQEGIIRFVNPAAISLFGRSESELLDHFIGFPISAEVTEITLHHPQKAPIIAEMRVTNIIWEGEIAYLASLRDISEQQKLQNLLRQINQQLETRVQQRGEELLASEVRFRTLVQTVGTVIIALSPENRIIEWNQEAEKLYGYKRHQVIGENYLLLFLAPQERPKLAADIQKVLLGEETRNFENIVQNREGEDRYLIWNLSCLVNEQSQPIGVIASGQDITVRKRTEAALKQSEAQFRAIFENAPLAIALIDIQGNIMTTNSAFGEFLGYNQADSKSLSFASLSYPEDADLDLNLYQDLIAGIIDSYQIEKRYQHRDGHSIWTNLSTSLVRDGTHEPQFAITMLENISDRKNVEFTLQQALYKEKELNKLKTKFIDIASHEFKTPLTSILGFTELVERHYKKLSEEQLLKYLVNIKNAAYRINELINDVLSLSKIETIKITSNPTLFNLEEFCLNIIDEFYENPEFKHEINFYNQELNQKIIKLDTKLLRPIITNLLSNAIKYSPAGSVVNLIVMSNANQVMFQITDQGIGIPAEDQEHLFESFYRASNTGNITGTGLGLNIVLRYVELQRGTISFHSEVGVGSTFVVIIPYDLNNQLE